MQTNASFDNQPSSDAISSPRNRSDVKRNQRVIKVLRWANRKTNEELQAYMSQFPNQTAKHIAVLMKTNYENFAPTTKNFKLDIAAFVLYKRNSGEYKIHT